MIQRMAFPGWGNGIYIYRSRLGLGMSIRASWSFKYCHKSDQAHEYCNGHRRKFSCE